jgi:autotransporter-associated beta strand protein
MRLRLRLHLLPCLLPIAAGFLLSSAPIASASPTYAMTVSSGPTVNVTLSGGVFEPTGNGANLSTSSLVTDLISENVEVGGPQASQVTVESNVESSSTHLLTFDAGGGGAVVVENAPTIDAAGLVFDSPAELSGTITSTGTESYSGAVSLLGDTTIGASATTFGSTVDSLGPAYALSVNGSATFTQNVGTASALSSLDISGSGSTTLDSNFVITAGAQTYGEPLELNGTSSGTADLISNAGSITAASSVDGAESLDLTAASGTASLDGAVGAITSPAAVSVQAASIDLGAPVSTTGGQAYVGNVELTGDVTATSLGMSGVEIEFDGDIDGAHQLTASPGATAITRFEGGRIGSVTPLASLTTESTVILSDSVDTSGSQQYNQQVALGSGGGTFAVGSASSIGFSNGVIGSSLTMDGPGVLDLASSSDSFTGGVTVNGGTIAFTDGGLGSPTPTVTLAGGTLQWSGVNTTDISSKLVIGNGGGTLDTDGNDVTFANPVAGTGALAKTGSGTLTLTGTGSFGTSLTVQGGSLNVSGTTASPITIDSGGTLDCDSGTLNGGVINSGGTAIGAPDPPSSVTATPGFRSASVSFMPGSANCYPVSYSATAGPGGLSWGPQPSGPASFTGLTGAQPYTFAVTASNPVGRSTSTDSNTVTPTPYPPSVTISAPADAATYTQGQVLDAGYGCQDGFGGKGISACSGPVPAGAAIDTATLGTHSFTVTATSADGAITTKTVTYSVVAAASSPPTTGTTPAPPTGSTPSNRFTIVSVKVSRSGVATVRLNGLHGPGTLTLAARPAGRPSYSVHRALSSADRALTIVLAPSRRVRAAHRRLSARLTITYTPRGGTPRTATRTIRV